MGDYRGRDRYDADRRRSSRDDYYDRQRSDRYPPQHHSRSRSGERYANNRADDYPPPRDRYYDDTSGRNYRSPPPQHSDDYSPGPRSPLKREAEADLLQPAQPPPNEPRSDRHRPQIFNNSGDQSFDAGKPNSQIIFRGIDKEMTEADLSQFLINQGAAIESVIVIRDRETRTIPFPSSSGLSCHPFCPPMILCDLVDELGPRGFAFVKFLAVEAAQHYMELHAPTVEIGNNKVKIAYSLGRGDEDNGWTCDKCGLVNFPRREACYRCSFPRSDAAPSSPPKALTQKAHVYNDGEGDIGDTHSQFVLIRNLDTMLQEETVAKGLAKLDVKPKRILLIRDRKTKVSWGFAFAEYQDVSFAKTALERYQEYKNFKIEKSKVKMSFCHPGVFVPVYDDSGKYSFKTASGTRISYWDEHGYASEWAEPTKAAPQDEEIERFLNDIKKSEALHATAATIIQDPVILTPAQPDDSTKHHDATVPADQSKKKRKFEAVTAPRKAAPQLEKWTTKREELKASEANLGPFADLSQMCCLLCKRKFQSIEEIQKHERLSKLHESNLADDAIRTACLAKIQKRKQQQQQQQGTQETEASEYRDRAKERRIQFNQPHRPDLPHPNPRVAAKQAAARKQVSPEPDQPKTTKGAKLLAAMGWTEGSGLGAEGTGIVEPVKAGSYAEGVGLGAGSVKVVGEDLAGKEDDGSYRAYVRKVKDVARERYESANIFDEEE